MQTNAFLPRQVMDAFAGMTLAARTKLVLKQCADVQGRLRFILFLKDIIYAAIH
ncbi:MAG: hypothetical protein ABTQ34_03765 [Bdellovibrionales bacterium]